jgi:hypothetical protein
MCITALGGMAIIIGWLASAIIIWKNARFHERINVIRALALGLQKCSGTDSIVTFVDRFEEQLNKSGWYLPSITKKA